MCVHLSPHYLPLTRVQTVPRRNCDLGYPIFPRKRAAYARKREDSIPPAIRHRFCSRRMFRDTPGNVRVHSCGSLSGGFRVRFVASSPFPPSDSCYRHPPSSLLTHAPRLLFRALVAHPVRPQKIGRSSLPKLTPDVSPSRGKAELGRVFLRISIARHALLSQCCSALFVMRSFAAACIDENKTQNRVHTCN